jgi:hemoglobin
MVPAAVCVAVVAAAGAARAQGEKAPPGPLDGKSIDGIVYTNLRDVINRGADLYNSGDWNGCYRMYEGALMMIKPMLGHREKLQDEIAKGIANAQQDPMLYRRAFVLRAVIDQVRNEVNPNPKKPKDKDKEPVVKSKSLWERLGGEKGVTKIVDDFANIVTKDKKVNFFRDGKYKPTAEEIARMKRELVQQISQATGGPLRYEGPDMKKVHEGMGITDAQYTAAIEDFKSALELNSVAAEDVAKIDAALNSYRKEIVQPKKPDDKKPEDKKPIDKKSAETGDVTGKVFFKGQPLQGGEVTFIGKKTFKGAIDKDGTFRVKDIEPGEYKVAVTSSPAKVAPATPKPVAIPAKYNDPDTSGLTYTVLKGEQTYDIQLQ